MEFPSGRISPQSKKHCAPLTVTQIEVPERIVVPELSLEEFVFSLSDESVRSVETPTRRRALIPGPTEFAISLKAYVHKVAAIRPLCGYRDVQGGREKGENT
jgi:hypothetical protein